MVDFLKIAYAMKKDSPFYWAFNYHINQMKESGTFKKIENSYSGEGQVCADVSGKPLDMNQCFTAFFVMGVGGGFGLIFFL